MSTQCTPEELATLVLPGDIPGLLRRGSPVLVNEEGDRNIGTVTHPYCKGAAFVAVYGAHEFDGVAHGDDTYRARLALDLTDAIGRDHFDRWLAKLHTGIDMPAMLDWHPQEGVVLVTGFRSSIAGGAWAVAGVGLDFADPRRLPDGSAWWAAELRRRIGVWLAAAPQADTTAT